MIKKYFNEIDEDVKKLEHRYLEMSELKRKTFITKIDRLFQIDLFLQDIIKEINYQENVCAKAQKSIKNSILLLAFLIVAAATAPTFLGNNDNYSMLVSVVLGLSFFVVLVYLADDVLTFFMSWSLMQQPRQNGNFLLIEFKIIAGIDYGPRDRWHSRENSTRVVDVLGKHRITIFKSILKKVEEI